MGDRDISFHNETNFNLGWQNKDGLLKNLSTTLGWNLIHGGLLGNFARYDYNATWMSDEDVYIRNTHSVIQEFYLTLDYGLPGNMVCRRNHELCLPGHDRLVVPAACGVSGSYLLRHRFCIERRDVCHFLLF